MAIFLDCSAAVSLPKYLTRFVTGLIHIHSNYIYYPVYIFRYVCILTHVCICHCVYNSYMR